MTVAVEEELPSRPLITPEKTCESNGVKLFPLDRSILEFWRPGVSNLVACIEDAIPNTSGSIAEKFQIRCSRPMEVWYDGMAVPTGKKPEPPINIRTAFAVHGDIVVQEACGGREIDKTAQEDTACRNYPTG